MPIYTTFAPSLARSLRRECKLVPHLTQHWLPKLTSLRIESEEDQHYLLQRILLQRFSIIIGSSKEESEPANVIERAVDLHALRVIGSSGYQQCIKYLWRGWIIQDDDNPTQFVFYEDRINTAYTAHLDPDRMRVPMYQNALQILFSLIYLALYSGAINTVNPGGDIDIVEVFLVSGLPCRRQHPLGL